MAEQAKKRKFEQVNAEFHKLKTAGDSIEGFVVDVQESPVGTTDKTRPVFILKTEDGRLLKVPVSESCRPEIVVIGKGEYVRITFAGEQATARGLNPVKTYRFERATE